MSQPASPTNLGFLTVLHETNGYLGGYLVTNIWGRPLEFRVTTAVQPNRIQQILYAGTLESYLHAELIGKTLVDKTGIPVQLIVTDRQPVLELRWKVEVPVVWLPPRDDPRSAALVAQGAQVWAAENGHGPLVCHPRFTGDRPAIQELLGRLDGALDLGEPFVRIREAISEARKMGVTSKA
ncbi:MAG: hypothetical protein NZ700_00865 [Gemmataceae bacterium]|nr:hypothetical protein [Gemmataceae bacterium]MDW8266380.1 hypothetical protein [Gemmataceae bacterium]